MVWQSNKALLVFLAVSSGIFYAILISFAEALTQRILQAHYYKSRRQIKSKWRHILGGRSKCDHCEKKLNAVNLVPVFGYWLSGRKCDNCGNAIKARYWLSELAAFVYGTIVFWLYPDITYALTTGAYLVILDLADRDDACATLAAPLVWLLDQAHLNPPCASVITRDDNEFEWFCSRNQR